MTQKFSDYLLEAIGVPDLEAQEIKYWLGKLTPEQKDEALDLMGNSTNKLATLKSFVHKANKNVTGAFDQVEGKSATFIASSTTFFSEIRSLSSELHGFSQSVDRGLYEDPTSYNKQMKRIISRWFAAHSHVIIDAAKPLAKRSSACKRISKIPMFAYKSDYAYHQEKQMFSKSDGFWLLHDNIPAACAQLNNPELGKDYITAFNRALESVGKSPKKDVDPDQPDYFDDFYYNVNQPDYHERLKQTSAAASEQYKQADQTVQATLATLSPVERKALASMLFDSKNKIGDLHSYMNLSPSFKQRLITILSHSTNKLQSFYDFLKDK